MLSINEINLLQAQNEGLKKQNKELQHYLACMTEQRNKANTCLQEIKEMILYCDDEYDCDKCLYHDKCQPNEGEFPDFSKALLQKIAESEVE